MDLPHYNVAYTTYYELSMALDAMDLPEGTTVTDAMGLYLDLHPPNTEPNGWPRMITPLLL
jgi:hypothetical protein